MVGPLADDPTDQLGPDVPIGYTASDQAKVVPVLDGIKAAVPNATVTYAQGCDASCTSTSGFGAAVSAAQSAAVTVIVAGEPAADTGEASSRSNIDLPGQQPALVQAIAATGKPYVVVLMNGRPLTIGWLADNAPGAARGLVPRHRGRQRRGRRAVRQGRPGRQAADDLPAQRRADPDLLQRAAHRPPVRPVQQVHVAVPGRAQHAPVPLRVRAVLHHVLAVQPAPVGQQPVHARHAESHRRRSPTPAPSPGDDVAQLYTHEDGTTILQPVRRLEGFQRVTLAPGQTKTVTFTLGRSNLGFYNNAGQFEIDPGPVSVWVGDSSTGGLTGQFTIKG